MTDRFTLLSELGSGGMGAVWKARDAETGEVVALKLVHPHLARDPGYVARFEREVDVAQRIDSSNVVKVLGYGTRDGVPFMAMEYVEGQSLRELLAERGKLSWEQAKPIVRQVAQGLAAAHAAGVIHRDVKPSNILITPDGTAKLADFGIARAGDLTPLTGSLTMLGTSYYMAPEGKASEQTDLYALGCVLYEMLAGHPPFEGDTPQEIILRHIREEPAASELPSGQGALIAGWLLQKLPERRPRSATELIAVIEGSTVVPRLVPPRSPRFGWVAAALVLPVMIIAGVVVMMLASGGEDQPRAGGESGLSPTATKTGPSAATASATRPGAASTANAGSTRTGATSTASPIIPATPPGATATPGQGSGGTGTNPTATRTPTRVPSSTPRPSATTSLPSSTPRPPTSTPHPPTATPQPPTATPRPPTSTPVPPSYNFSIWLRDGTTFAQGSPVYVCGQISPAGVTVYVTFSFRNPAGATSSQQVGWSASSGTYCGWNFANIATSPGSFSITATARVDGAVVGSSTVSGTVQ